MTSEELRKLTADNERLGQRVAELERDAKRYRIVRAQFMYPAEVESHIDGKIDAEMEAKQ